MTFRRFGRSYHLAIKTAEDIEQILRLDEAHWVSTNAPIRIMNCDPAFLDILDSDKNGRIMCFELRDAVRWALKILKDRTGITKSSLVLNLENLNTDDDEGSRINISAGKILDRLGKSQSRQITLEEVRTIKSSIENSSVSEAGVVLPQAGRDEQVREFLNDIIKAVGGVPHPNGEAGVNREKLDEFLSQIEEYSTWKMQGKIYGDEIPKKFDIFSALRDKIDQYFAQCQATAFDQRLKDEIRPTESEIQSLDTNDPDSIQNFFKDAPLRVPCPEQILQFDDKINPFYAPKLEVLKKQIFETSTSEISFEDWKKTKDSFSEYESWIKSKPETSLENLDQNILDRYRDEKYRQAVESLIDESSETALAMDNVRLIEKAILFQAYLLILVNNFVSFPCLYDANQRAIFEMGTLVMDGRKFNFSIKVHDLAAHSKVARSSDIFVLYVEVIPPAPEEKYLLAVPITSGGKGNLTIGKRGIFQDVSGQEFNARVVQIIENPISIIEALISPFQRIVQIITGKIESITSSVEKKLDASTVQMTNQIESAAAAKQQGKPPSGLLTGGMLMGGGVAIAAIGTAATYIIKTLTNLGLYKILAGLLGIIFAVALPISILAFLKLRRRDLSSILEASGWAVNARMRLTFRQGRFFTQQPGFPKGANFENRRIIWLTIIAIILILLLLIRG